MSPQKPKVLGTRYYRIYACCMEDCSNFGIRQTVEATVIGPFLSYPNLSCSGCGVEPRIIPLGEKAERQA